MMFSFVAGLPTMNSEEANEASQKEDQIRTDLEGAENQTVKPKKMIFKIPKS